jgi:hypothetical protein
VAEPGGQNKSSEWINGADPSSFVAKEEAARFNQEASNMSESDLTKHNIIVWDIVYVFV